MKQTRTQQNSLHLWARRLADALNAAGYDMRRTLRSDWEIPWTEENVKEHIIKPVAKAMYDKDSTKDLTTFETQQVYEVANRHLAEHTGVHVPFPSIEEN